LSEGTLTMPVVFNASTPPLLALVVSSLYFFATSLMSVPFCRAASAAASRCSAILSSSRCSKIRDRTCCRSWSSEKPRLLR